MTHSELFDRARALTAQSPHPTDWRTQLRILASRKRKNYGRVKIKPDPFVKLDEPGPKYPWQSRADLQ